LSIAKKLVELQGGTLSVKSELDVGSEFSFCISYKKASDVHEESEKVEEEKKKIMEVDKLEQEVLLQMRLPLQAKSKQVWLQG